MRLKLALCAIALVAASGGCTSGSPDTPPPATSSATVAGSAPAWTEPPKYAFVLNRQCEGGPSAGLYHVEVSGGQIVTADRIDGRTAAGEEEIDVPTLRGLLEMAQTAADDGGQVSTTLDPKDGHPTVVSIDVSDGGSDSDSAAGKSCFKITGYAPAS